MCGFVGLAGVNLDRLMHANNRLAHRRLFDHALFIGRVVSVGLSQWSWLFSGSLRSADASATLYSLI